MHKDLICKSLVIHTTTVCTLKCEKCSWSFPRFKKPYLANVERTIHSLEKVFQIYDRVHELRFCGAEAFLYPDIIPMMQGVSKYKDKFDYAIILTNGTYIPSKEILEAMTTLSYPLMVRVDDYGDLSTKYGELINTLKAYGLNVDERIYTGDDQAFGGWVDFGDYTNKHYTEEELKKVFDTCRMPDDCTNLINDKLTNCNYSTAGYMLGKLPMPEREIVDLSGNDSIEQMREKIISWRDKPFEACKYCNGFDPMNSPRIPAAKQIGD